MILYYAILYDIIKLDTILYYIIPYHIIFSFIKLYYNNI